MDVIVHDLGKHYSTMLANHCDHVIEADGRYAGCQGCFGCWTKHPAACFIKDKLHMVCRVIGQADRITIITENLYGSYSPQVKAVLDRSIGSSTPLSCYRGGQMHHCLRYGPHDLWRVVVYGDVTAQERETFRLLARRNAINEGFERFEVAFLEDLSKLRGAL
ncbi:flavodoxin family protein [Olsenella massiliensis]|uniref:flavodoxin family protein n=1 Tax=Olsenella massiliensis TaxID=1622075 RepID=UPI00071E20E1|nr:flavodoxin family protein [Olsenella massiliensis]